MFEHLNIHTYEQLGPSVEGRPIELLQLTKGSGPDPVNLLLVGGVHGDEPEGFYLIEEFIKQTTWKELEGMASLWVLPRLNPDACEADKRVNSNGVDLNRNLPTKDWTAVVAKERYNPGKVAGSEVENHVLMQTIERLNPRLIISAHSWEPMVNYNGPAKKVAEVMAQYSKYIITDDIGYPTPGSLGTWAGWERKIPTITLEIERGTSPDTIWKTHHEGILAGLLYAAVNENLES